MREDARKGQTAAPRLLRLLGAGPLRVRLRDGCEGLLAQPADDPRADRERLIAALPAI
ncbi:L-seryl-tRNA(Sec) selenium transferase [Burkholderia sp. IT-111MI5]